MHPPPPRSLTTGGYPDVDERRRLADRAGIAEAQVSNWFANRRQYYRKNNMEIKGIPNPSRGNKPRGTTSGGNKRKASAAAATTTAAAAAKAGRRKLDPSARKRPAFNP